MKKLYIILLLINITVWNAMAQSPAWLWAKSAAGNAHDQARDVAVDGNGNVFVTGLFESDSITFGTTTFHNTDTNISGFFSGDIFVVKYDASGNVLWAKSASGNFQDETHGICTDGSGNVLVTGFFQSDSITFGTTTLVNLNGGSYDFFIAKYDAAGNVMWAKSAGGNLADVGYGIAADDSGNVLVTGYYELGTITFDTIVLSNSNGWGDDVFIVKYDPSGNVLWAKSGGGTSGDGGKSISVDGSGNVVATGIFRGSSITFGTTVLTNTGNPYAEIFIVKYDAAGNLLWAKSVTGSGVNYDDWLNNHCNDANGNVYVTGYFKSDSITFGTTVLTKASGSSTNFFIAKFDSSGNTLWAKSAGGAGFNSGIGISIDANGIMLATGYFDHSITFGTTVLTGGGNNDIFVASYDTSGNALGATSAGGTGHDMVFGISTDGIGNTLIAGYFVSDSATFGSTTLKNNSGIPGNADMFVAKLDCISTNALLQSSDTTFCEKKCLDFTDLSTNNPVSWQWFFPGADSTFSTLQNPTGICYNSFGSFDVTLVTCNAVSCDTLFLPGFINVYPSPAVTISFSGDTLFASPAFSYQWYTSSGAIPGATAGFYIPPSPGDYYVIATDSNGCPGSSPVFTLIGIDELQNDPSVLIFPNPSDGPFRIVSSENMYEIKIFNLTGQIIYQSKPNENNISLRLDEAGIYFIQIMMKGHIVTKKLIISR